LVQWVVARYGGTVRIEDNDPCGTVVTLVLNTAETESLDLHRQTTLVTGRLERQ
jgi:hypothetical protein